MAEVTINNSPVHSDTILTGVYGQTGPSWKGCGFHTGTDFAPYGNTPSINAPLYSVCNGTVVQVRTESALGNVIVIKEDNSNRYWRFCHMNSSSPLSVGMSVTTSTVVGYMRSIWNRCTWCSSSFRMFNYSCLAMCNIFKL